MKKVTVSVLTQKFLGVIGIYSKDIIKMIIPFSSTLAILMNKTNTLNFRHKIKEMILSITFIVDRALEIQTLI